MIQFQDLVPKTPLELERSIGKHLDLLGIESRAQLFVGWVVNFKIMVMVAVLWHPRISCVSGTLLSLMFRALGELPRTDVPVWDHIRKAVGNTTSVLRGARRLLLQSCRMFGYIECPRCCFHSHAGVQGDASKTPFPIAIPHRCAAHAPRRSFRGVWGRCDHRSEDPTSLLAQGARMPIS